MNSWDSDGNRHDRNQTETPLVPFFDSRLALADGAGGRVCGLVAGSRQGTAIHHPDNPAWL